MRRKAGVNDERGAHQNRGETAQQLDPPGQARHPSQVSCGREEKIRIVLEEVRAEVSVAELYWREGIHPTIYYKWLKDFMDAGKARLRGDTKREATGEEVEQLRGENERLKQLVADLSLANLTLKESLY